MGKKKLLQAMRTSISEVLETMFFLPVDRTEIADIDAFNKTLNDETELVEIAFSGLFSGSFLLLIPEDLALLLSASFLGIIEEKVFPAHISETKKEIVNMIAGNTFANFDDEVVFNLGIPQICRSQDLLKRFQTEDDVIFQSYTMEKYIYVYVNIEIPNPKQPLPAAAGIEKPVC